MPRRIGSATIRYLVMKLSGGWKGMCRKKPTWSWHVKKYGIEESNLQIAVQTPHYLPSQHEMIVVNPDEVLRSTVPSCIYAELVVHSDIRTPVLAENLKK